MKLQLRKLPPFIFLAFVASFIFMTPAAEAQQDFDFDRETHVHGDSPTDRLSDQAMRDVVLPGAKARKKQQKQKAAPAAFPRVGAGYLRYESLGKSADAAAYRVSATDGAVLEERLPPGPINAPANS